VRVVAATLAVVYSRAVREGASSSRVTSSQVGHHIKGSSALRPLSFVGAANVVIRSHGRRLEEEDALPRGKTCDGAMQLLNSNALEVA
jgi:hypothetical protein